MGIDASKEWVWHCKTWSELDRDTLYAMLRLRAEVFVVEQNCAYQDLDGKDKVGLHLWAERAAEPAREGGQVYALTRLLPVGSSYPNEVSIGRVVTSENARGTGLGRELMKRSLLALDEHWEGEPIRLSAQCYLERFYSDFGFKPEGESYLEDGIPHIAMIRPAGRP